MALYFSYFSNRFHDNGLTFAACRSRDSIISSTPTISLLPTITTTKSLSKEIVSIKWIVCKRIMLSKIYGLDSEWKASNYRKITDRSIVYVMNRKMPFSNGIEKEVKFGLIETIYCYRTEKKPYYTWKHFYNGPMIL